MRSLLRKLELTKSRTTRLRNVPLIKLDPDLWQPHFDVFGQKMMLALHYKIFKKPLSLTGKIAFSVHTNVRGAGRTVLEEMANLTNLTMDITNGKNNLRGQFDVRYQFEPETLTGLWCFVFHKRLAFTGLTTESYPGYADFGDRHFGPFSVRLT